MSTINENQEMYAGCPYCNAVFRLSQEKLNFKEGVVRCGACREIFNAKWNLVEKTASGFTAPSREVSDIETDPEEDEIARDSKFGQINSEADSSRDSLVGDDDHLLPSTYSPFQDSFDHTDSTESKDDHITQTDEMSKVTGFEPASEESDTALSANAEIFERYQEPLTDPEPVGFDQEPLTDPEPVDFDQEFKIDLMPGQSDPPVTESVHDAFIEAQEPELKVQTANVNEKHDEAGNSISDHTVGSEKDDSALHDDFIDHSDDSGLQQLAALDLGEERPSQHSINMNGVDHIISHRTNPLISLAWFFVAIGFVFLLGLQAKYFFVERYAQDEHLRPYLTVFCKVAQCQMPARQDLFRFTLTNTKIDLHPAEPGALRVTVKLVNEASFDQPYPNLQLTLTDRVGRVVGRRTFPPEFYLSTSQSNLLQAGQLGSIWFDLANPHEKAVGFVVDIVTTPATLEARAG